MCNQTYVSRFFHCILTETNTLIPLSLYIGYVGYKASQPVTARQYSDHLTISGKSWETKPMRAVSVIRVAPRLNPNATRPTRSIVLLLLTTQTKRGQLLFIFISNKHILNIELTAFTFRVHYNDKLKKIDTEKKKKKKISSSKTKCIVPEFQKRQTRQRSRVLLCVFIFAAAYFIFLHL